LEYLAPTLLEDDKTLADIQRSLLDGQLVVIRDAFIPEYVWKQIDRDDLNWTRKDVNSDSQSSPGHISGHISRKHRLADKKAYSTELVDVLDKSSTIQ
jgi:hypothetical protein